MRAAYVFQAGLYRREDRDRGDSRGEGFLAFANKRVNGMPKDARHRGNIQAPSFVVNEQGINQVGGRQMRLRDESSDRVGLTQAAGPYG